MPNQILLIAVARYKNNKKVLIPSISVSIIVIAVSETENKKTVSTQ
jgi:hypothetical protein